MGNHNGVWLTWETQRRNKGISSALGWELHEITYANPRIKRYMKSMLKTYFILHKSKPDYVVAQNPSFLLALMVVLLKYVFGYTAIIDAHNAGLFPLEGKNRVLGTISKITQALADVTIVTNNYLSEVVSHNGGRGFVLQDRLPEVPKTITRIKLEGKFNFVFICSFGADEPYQQVLEAASLIPKDIFIYITGNYSNKIDREKVPGNVVLLGFIPENEYWNTIYSADAIIVLTTRENCLVCGAYEAVALNKPMILSDTFALKEYFASGCVFSKPDATCLHEAILLTIDDQERLKAEIVSLGEELRDKWEKTFDHLLSYMTSLR